MGEDIDASQIGPVKNDPMVLGSRMKNKRHISSGVQARTTNLDRLRQRSLPPHRRSLPPGALVSATGFPLWPLILRDPSIP
jgi:hypothetical protein